MPSVSTATVRHLRRANGYLGLGMLNEASEELEAIEGEDRLSDEVLELRSNLYMQAKQWELLEADARELTRRDRSYEKGWIDRAFALREMNQIAEAKAVLLEAEPTSKDGRGDPRHFGVYSMWIACGGIMSCKPIGVTDENGCGRLPA